jgi:hypothetical protein
MSVAAIPGVPWLSRETIRRMYGYLFHELGCQMVVNRIDAADERLLAVRPAQLRFHSVPAHARPRS